MDHFISVLNACVCFIFATVVTWAIVTPKVDDAVVIKSGLILADLGFVVLGWKFWGGIDDFEISGVLWGTLFTNTGALVIVGGYVWRVSTRGNQMRRLTDWSSLQDTRPMEKRS